MIKFSWTATPFTVNLAQGGRHRYPVAGALDQYSTSIGNYRERQEDFAAQAPYYLQKMEVFSYTIICRMEVRGWCRNYDLFALPRSTPSDGRLPIPGGHSRGFNVSGSRIRDSSNRQPLCQVLQRVATQQSITHVIYYLYPCPILGQLKSDYISYAVLLIMFLLTMFLSNILLRTMFPSNILLCAMFLLL